MGLCRHQIFLATCYSIPDDLCLGNVLFGSYIPFKTHSTECPFLGVSCRSCVRSFGLLWCWKGVACGWGFALFWAGRLCRDSFFRVWDSLSFLCVCFRLYRCAFRYILPCQLFSSFSFFLSFIICYTDKRHIKYYQKCIFEIVFDV